MSLGEGVFGVTGSEAKEDSSPARARSLRVDPGATHIPGRFLRRCGSSLQPSHSWGAASAPQDLEAPDSFSSLALCRVCPLRQKVPCDPLGGQVPGLQLGLAGHGSEGKRSLLDLEAHL